MFIFGRVMAKITDIADRDAFGNAIFDIFAYLLRNIGIFWNSETKLDKMIRFRNKLLTFKI